MPKMTIPFLLIFAMLTATAAYAQWNPDPAVNLDVIAAPNGQFFRQLALDYEGGAFIAWWDQRAAVNNADIYVQHFDRGGYKLWTPTGILICNATGSQKHPRLVQDGLGGIMIFWEDFRAGTGAAACYGQRMISDGTMRWTPNGIALSTFPDSFFYTIPLADGHNGAYLIWNYFGVNPGDIGAQRVDVNGTRLWGLAGVNVCNATGAQTNHDVMYDSLAEGVYIVWDDHRGTNKDIYAQRLDANGAPRPGWPVNGLQITNLTYDQEYPRVCSDGAGGIIIAWWDHRGADGDIYAQRVNPNGTVAWAANGVPVCTATGHQRRPVIQPDGSAGAVVAWIDGRASATVRGDDIYAQRLSPTGTLLWGSELVVCGADSNQDDLESVPTGFGMVAVWKDRRSGPDDIYAAQIIFDGTFCRPSDVNGTPVCIHSAIQEVPYLVLNQFNETFVAWRDQRPGGGVNGEDIYIQALDLCGPPQLQRIRVTSRVHDFGPVPLGINAPWYLAIENIGAMPLHVTGLSMTDGMPGSLTHFNFTPATVGTLNPGQYQFVIINYHPSVLGNHAVNFEVTSDDPTAPSILITPIQGQGVQPNTAPTVANVTGAQRLDGSKIVDIGYDLSDAESESIRIVVDGSTDGGTTWGTLPMSSLSGDVGRVSPGIGRTIRWAAGVDWLGNYSDSARFRVRADDQDYHLCLPTFSDHDTVMVVPASWFQMGLSASESTYLVTLASIPADSIRDERPLHWVYLDSFGMRRYEVTNQQFKAFVDAGGYSNGAWWRIDDGSVGDINEGWTARSAGGWTRPAGWAASGASPWQTDPSSFLPDAPVVGISWYEAWAYAKWYSSVTGSTWTIPTEAQWERAARGCGPAYAWPWGGIYCDNDHDHANIRDVDACQGDPYPVCMAKNRLPTGVSAIACFAMGGNAAEWTRDSYLGSAYASSPSENPYILSGSGRTVRGGDWMAMNGQWHCRSGARRPEDASYRGGDVGFRVVRVW